MALDESKDNDEVHEMDGFKLVADRDVIDRYGDISVQFREHPWGGGGFVVQPAAGLPEGSCGSCSC